MTWKQIALIVILAAMVAGGAFWSGTCYQKQHDIADWNTTKPDTVIVSDTTRIKFLESQLGAVDARLSSTKVRLDAVQYKRMQETLILRRRNDSLMVLLTPGEPTEPRFIAVETASMDTSFPVNALIQPTMVNWGSDDVAILDLMKHDFSVQTTGHIKTEYIGQPINQFNKTSFLLDPIQVPTDKMIIRVTPPIVQKSRMEWWERAGWAGIGGAIVLTLVAVAR